MRWWCSRRVEHVGIVEHRSEQPFQRGLNGAVVGEGALAQGRGERVVGDREEVAHGPSLQALTGLQALTCPIGVRGGPRIRADARGTVVVSV